MVTLRPRDISRNQLFRAFGLAVGYIGCIWAIRLIFLTITTYILVQSQESLQRVGDFERANQVVVYGVSAALFCILLQALHPLTRTKWNQIFNLSELKSRFASNSFAGFVMGAVLVIATLVGGHMSSLGIYLRFDEVAVSLLTVFIFALSFFVLFTVEEFIFRRSIEPLVVPFVGTTAAAIFIAVLYLFVRFIQFDLGWIEALNFGILSLCLSSTARRENTHMASSCFASSFFILLHTFFGLPLLGEDMPRIWLLQANTESSVATLLSGGARGPEASLVLTLLLIIYLYLSQMRSKKSEV